MKKVRVQIKNEEHEVEIPTGCAIVCGGPVQKNDLAYNAGTRNFEKVLIDGNVNVAQCHLIVREAKK